MPSSGVETSLYFENLVLATLPEQYAFDVQCARGRQWALRWSVTPAASDVGEHPLLLEVRDEQNELLGRARSTLPMIVASGCTKAVGSMSGTWSPSA